MLKKFRVLSVPEFCSQCIFSESVALNQGRYCTAGTFCNVWRHFLDIESVGMLLTSYKEQTPQQKSTKSKMSLLLLLRNLQQDAVCATDWVASSSPVTLGSFSLIQRNNEIKLVRVIIILIVDQNSALGLPPKEFPATFL